MMSRLKKSCKLLVTMFSHDYKCMACSDRINSNELNDPCEHCEAIQYSDQMVCKRCSLTWDVNDSDPPKCKGEEK